MDELNAKMAASRDPNLTSKNDVKKLEMLGVKVGDELRDRARIHRLELFALRQLPRHCGATERAVSVPDQHRTEAQLLASVALPAPLRIRRSEGFNAGRRESHFPLPNRLEDVPALPVSRYLARPVSCE